MAWGMMISNIVAVVESEAASFHLARVNGHEAAGMISET